MEGKREGGKEGLHDFASTNKGGIEDPENTVSLFRFCVVFRHTAGDCTIS